MAYVSPDTTRRRAATLGAVAAVHGVMAFAILTGFAGGIVKVIEDQRLKVWNYVAPLDEPKPLPTVTPSPVPSTHPRDTAVKPDIVLPLGPLQDPGIPFDRGLLPAGGEIGPLLPPPIPSASASASFTPRAARPLTAPGQWVSETDYPTGALRRGEQGVTGFEITVGPDGRVRDCTVTRSSGSAELDAATCAKVSQRARFAPASDDQGAIIAGRYANAIRWQIPQ